MPIEDNAALGATRGAIEHHYDVGTDFYRLWLDSSLTYSGALWDGADDSLESAQMRKLDFHAAAGARCSRVWWTFTMYLTLSA
jgi:cyclopropane-fatty-acyl-phospholipid synthase